MREFNQNMTSYGYMPFGLEGEVKAVATYYSNADTWGIDGWYDGNKQLSSNMSKALSNKIEDEQVYECLYWQFRKNAKPLEN